MGFFSSMGYLKVVEYEDGKIFRSRVVRWGERVGRCLLGMGERRESCNCGCDCGWGAVVVGGVRGCGEGEGFVGGVWEEGLFFVLFFISLFS